MEAREEVKQSNKHASNVGNSGVARSDLDSSMMRAWFGVKHLACDRVLYNMC